MKRRDAIEKGYLVGMSRRFTSLSGARKRTLLRSAQGAAKKVRLSSNRIGCLGGGQEKAPNDYLIREANKIRFQIIKNSFHG